MRSTRFATAVVLASVSVLTVAQVAHASQPVRFHDAGYIEDGNYVDFDRDVFGHRDHADFTLQSPGPAERLLEKIYTARFRDVGAARPSYRQCSTIRLFGANQNMVSTPVGDWLCFKTRRGRFGRFRFDGLDAYPSGMHITYTVWQF